MRKLREWMSRFGGLFGQQRKNRELDEEIESHLQMHIEDNLRLGMTPEEARRQAMIKLGGVESTKEAYRDQRSLPGLETSWQDLRYAARQLRKNPGFTAVVVFTLALGIGANTAIFSVVDAVLLKSLPVKKPEQLYQIAHAGTRGVMEGNNFPFFEHLRDHSQSFDGLLAFNPNPWKVTIDGNTEIVSGQVVTGNYFSVLGVDALLGRVLTPEDDKVPQGHPVAAISYGYWQRRFGGDPDVLGKTVTINLTPFTVIGVTPPEFFGVQVGRSADISVPMAMHSLVGSGAKLNEHKFWWNLPILGRLKAGVSREQASAELDLLQHQFLTEAGMPEEKRKDFFVRCKLMPAQRGLAELRKQFSSPLQVLMGIVGLVLLIACANVANLLLARAATRQKEISIRLAVGASRTRLIRQLLTESVLLASLGGGLGLLLAYWGAQSLLGFIPSRGAALTLHFIPDARILSFTAVLSLLTGTLFGLAPAWRATRVPLHAALKDRASRDGGRTRSGFGKMLVVSQMTLSLLLLIGAGLFVRSLQQLRQVETGFHRQEHVLLVSLDCYGTAYQGPRLSTLHQELLERMNGLPGVRSASLSTAIPFRGGVDATRIFLAGAAAHPEDEEINVIVVAPRYFETLGVPLVAGRDFGPQDGEPSPRVAVVSESMARRYFPNENPLGKRFSLTRQEAGKDREIVGVVKDARFGGHRQENTPMVYLSHQQDWTRPAIHFALRATGDPAAVIATVRQTIQSVGKDIPVAKIVTLRAQADEALAKERLVATLSGFFGLVALLLAGVGLFGLVSHGVGRRTNEIGIRMALGARRPDVLNLILKETLLLVLPGVLLGLVAAVIATRFIASLLFGVTATDPVTFVVAPLVLLAVALLACLIPARRAMKVDPMVALRYE